MQDEKSTSDTFQELWQRLDHNQQRFAVAMLTSATKKEAAESIGLQPNTIYKWNGDIDTAVEFMRNHATIAALGIVQANATKAAMVKAAGLDSADEKIRQDVATEILDRNLGKPKQRQEVTGADGGPVRIEAPVVYIPANGRDGDYEHD